MGQIFRKSLLDKLSSPEQLDKMIVITPPSFWIALSGAAIIIVSAVVWGFFGKLPVNVNTQGIYVNEEGTQTVCSDTAGVISEVFVDDGSQVKKGDIIATLNTEEIDEKIADYEKRIKAVEKITMDSTNDVVTSDSKNLVDVKNQMITVEQTLNQDQAMLELRTKELADKKAQAARSEAEFLAAEAAYYNSLYLGNNTAEQLYYSEAQSALSTAGQYLESANSSLGQAQVAYVQADAQYNQIKNEYKSFLAAKKSVVDNATEKTNELDGKLQAVNYLGDFNTETTGFDFSNTTLFPSQDLLTQEVKDAINQALADYLIASKERDTFLANNAGVQEKYEQNLNQQKISLEAAESTKNNAQNSVNNYKQQKESASSQYEAARSAYIAKTNAVNQEQQKQSELGSEYNQAMNKYSTDQNAVTSLEDTVEQLTVQVQIDQQNVDNQIDVIYSQFHATKESIIGQLQMECEEYRKKKERAQIKATADGVISNFSINEGSVVGQGTQVAMIRMGEGEKKIIVCYAPVSLGKKVHEGMEVMVYPSTVNKQEYGHMEAEVIWVDSYITSTEDMRRHLGDDKLVESFLKDGPVVEITCELKTSDKTASGYYWSSKKGADLLIDDGTMVEADVVVDRKAPITMLIPYIKEKLTIKAED